MTVNRPVTTIARLTAGLMWPPEVEDVAETVMRMLRPNANAIATRRPDVKLESTMPVTIQLRDTWFNVGAMAGAYAWQRTCG